MLVEWSAVLLVHVPTGYLERWYQMVLVRFVAEEMMKMSQKEGGRPQPVTKKKRSMCWILLAAAVAGIAEHSCGAVAATGMIGSGVGALEGAKRNAHQPIACDETKTPCDAVVHANAARPNARCATGWRW